MPQHILQMVNRVGAGFCPEPQPAGTCHISRQAVTDDLDRILMQDQPSKFYYVITGAHGMHAGYKLHIADRTLAPAELEG